MGGRDIWAGDPRASAQKRVWPVWSSWTIMPAAVLELLGLHLLELRRVLRAQTEGVEVDVAGRVAGAELEVVLRHGRLHPAAERTERLRDRDEEEDHRPEALRHLPELVDRDAVDAAAEERGRARLADEEADGRHHRHAPVGELRLAVALELRLGHALGEVRRVEEANRVKDARGVLHVREIRRVVAGSRR